MLDYTGLYKTTLDYTIQVDYTGPCYTIPDYTEPYQTTLDYTGWYLNILD